MKKIIIPIASVVTGAAAAVGIITFAPNKAVAELPDPTLPVNVNDGCYYIDGDPANNELYLIIENGTFRYASDTLSIREAFTIADRNDEEMFFETEEAFEAQVDSDMLYWGGTYTYNTFVLENGHIILDITAGPDEHSDKEHIHGGVPYDPNTDTIRSWGVNYTLYKEEPELSDDTPADITDIDDVNTDLETEA